MSQPALTISGNNNVIRNVSASSTHLAINYGDLHVGEPNGVNITAGGRTIDFFLSPNNFPILINGDIINLQMCYGDETEEMAVQRLNRDGEALATRELDIFDMTEYQKTVAFLYLVGAVTNDTDS